MVSYRYFTQLDLNGHECEHRNDVDELLKVLPGDSRFSRLQRWWCRRCLISERNYRSYKYMRSQSAINYEKNRQIRQYHWMIHPFSEFRIVYEIIMMFIFLITLTYLPVDALFDIEKKVALDFLDYLVLLTDVFSWFGLIINFRTGHLVYKTKEVYLTPRYAAKYYFRGYFFLDLVTAIPYHFMEYELGNNSDDVGAIVDIISLVRMLRVFPLLVFYQNTVEVFGVPHMLSKLIRMFLIVILFLHWSACTHFLAAKIVQQRNCLNMNPKSWLAPLCQDRLTTSAHLYIESLFRSVSNSFKNGYGHTMPVTNEDMLVTTVCLVTGSVLSVFTTATIISIVTTQYASSAKYFKMSTQVHCYLRNMKLPQRLHDKVMSYYDYRFHRSFFREDEIMSTINSELQQEIMLHSCQRLVENVSFFSNIPMAMMGRIVAHMRSEIYMPNDVIIRHGEKGESMYFIKTGTVAIYTGEGVEVCHLEDGAHFGEISLVLPDDRRVATVIAAECSWLYRLDKNDFLRAVSPFPDLLVRIEHTAKERLSRTEEMHVGRDGRLSLTTWNMGAPTRRGDKHDFIRARL